MEHSDVTRTCPSPGNLYLFVTTSRDGKRSRLSSLAGKLRLPSSDLAEPPQFLDCWKFPLCIIELNGGPAPGRRRCTDRAGRVTRTVRLRAARLPRAALRNLRIAGGKIYKRIQTMGSVTNRGYTGGIASMRRYERRVRIVGTEIAPCEGKILASCCPLDHERGN